MDGCSVCCRSISCCYSFSYRWQDLSSKPSFLPTSVLGHCIPQKGLAWQALGAVRAELSLTPTDATKIVSEIPAWTA